jgi:hypothetical protein
MKFIFTNIAGSIDTVVSLDPFNKFKIISYLLHRETATADKTTQQLVIPMEFRNKILTELHDKFGHPGRERTTSLIKDIFY